MDTPTSVTAAGLGGRDLGFVNNDLGGYHVMHHFIPPHHENCPGIEK